MIFRGESSDKHIDASDNTVLPRVFNPSFADAEIFENHLCAADIYLHLKRAYFCGNFTFVVSYHVEQYYFTSLTQAKRKL